MSGIQKEPNTDMAVCASAAEICVMGLLTEFVNSPVGVETRQPLLSWRIVSSRRGARQSAYQIEVASSAEALVSGQPDLWDSGRVVSDHNLGIRYAGAPLASRQRCFWRVHLWDERGVAVAPSQIAWWEMGLLDSSDWSAQWLAAEDPLMREDRAKRLGWLRAPSSPENEPTGFRLSFSTPAAGQAQLVIAANGAVKVWMDDQALTPTASVCATCGVRPPVELTVPLEAGRHVLAISLDRIDPRLEVFGIRVPEIAPFIRIRLTDGGSLRFSTEGWKSAHAKEEGWHTRRFDDRNWDEAVPVSASRPQPWPRLGAMFLRRSFHTSKPVVRARIYATALGAYELHLNGERVGDALLTPESTDFRWRALYRVYDVTGQVLAGENVLGAIVGDGWFGSYTIVAGRYPWGPPPRRLLAQLELTYTDGSYEIVATGPLWRVDRAPIVWSEIYDGEYYDARSEQPGWSTAGFDASRWWPAEVVPAGAIALTAQIAPPIRRETCLIPRRITESRPGVFVVDFGQNFSGWCRLRVQGRAGIIVTLRFGEILTSTGEVEQSNLGCAQQTDTYVLKGDAAGEIFEPHFTYHGFRYVQVSGFPGALTADALEGIVVHSDLRLTGRLNVDNGVIQQLWHNTFWSQRSNFMGVPTDCPQRDERLGWMGDANVFWDAAAFNMDVDAFTRRYMGDVRDAQADTGAFSDFSPAPFRVPAGAGSGTAVAAALNPNARIGASPGWADAGICLPWTVWWRYGDTGIIEENWDAMARYVAFIAASNPDFLWRHDRGADFGDWLALDAKNPGDPTTPKDLVATAIWAHSVSCMAQMAEATGRIRDAAHYRASWTNIARAFRENFIAADGTIGNDSQASYILALRYGLVPDALRAKAAARLVANIEGRGTLLATGFLGTPNSLDVLADAGYDRLVYSLLLRTEFPSWGYMVARGGTTIWERWNSDTMDLAMNSFNHYALGAVCGFIFRRIAAIAPLEPGFRKIEVRPVLDPRVKRGGGKYESVLGRIETAWQLHDGGGFSMDLTIPPNASARVCLPASPRMTVTEGGVPIGDNAEVREIGREGERVVVEVGSGRYQLAVWADPLRPNG